jgi:alpha-tubulin suppressor-like RCC1 family protein
LNAPLKSVIFAFGALGCLISTAGRAQTSNGNGTIVAWGDTSWGLTNLPPGLTNVVMIAAGDGHNLALKSDGRVVAWGFNDYYQTNVPAGLTNVLTVSAGRYSLALRADGTAADWGEDAEDGPFTVPLGLTNVVAISAGSYFDVALKADGTIVAWPYYFQGQLPADFTNLVAIAAGAFHILGLKADGTVVAWLYFNDYGQATVPAGLSNVVAIAAGNSHSLALKADGTVVAWGDNSSGQTNVPVGLTNVVAISSECAAAHCLALTGDGKVVARGNHSMGQTNVPTGLTNVVAIAAGGNHSLALLGDPSPFLTKRLLDQTVVHAETVMLHIAARGSAPMSFQWRFNGTNLVSATNSVLMLRDIQLNQAGVYSVVVSNAYGMVTNSCSLTVVSTLVITAWPQNCLTFVNARASFSIATLGNGLTYQWHFNGHALPGETNQSLVLLQVQPSQSGLYSVVVSNAVGVVNADASLSVSEVAAWGTPALPEAILGVKAVAAGHSYGLALETDGTVVSWDYSGTLGVQAGLSNVMAVAAGGAHVLALKSNGTVVTWGYDTGGSLKVPQGLSNVVAVAAGNAHSLALKSDGTVVAWGNNAYGQTNVPASLTSVVAITAGWNHNLALKSDGTVVAWGYNGFGQAAVPGGLSNVVAVAAAETHSLALKSDGTLACWGWSVMAPPAGLSNIVTIAAGEEHSLAIKADGTVVAWGLNRSGETVVPEGLTNVVTVGAGGNLSLAVVGTRPWMTGQSPNQTAEVGACVDFEAAVSGFQGLTYWWFFNGTNLISCSTNSWLELTNVQFSQSGTLTLVVTNRFGVETSSPVMLNVIAAVDRRLVPGVNLMGQPGDLLGLEYRDALAPGANWETLASLTLTNPSQRYFDLSAALPPQRFYRAWRSGSAGVGPGLDLKMTPAITLTGAVGSSWRLDCINAIGPTDAWVTLDTVTMTNTSQLYFDVTAPVQPRRLYRIVPVP